MKTTKSDIIIVLAFILLGPVTLFFECFSIRGYFLNIPMIISWIFTFVLALECLAEKVFMLIDEKKESK